MSDDNPSSGNGSSQKSWFEKLGQIFQGEPKDRDDLIAIIREAQQNSIIDSDAMQMLEGVLNVSHMRVRDIMIPRSQMVTIDRNQEVENFLPIVVESAHSRFPVISEDKDHVEGMLLAKDLLAYGFKKNEEPFLLEKILRPAVIVPESKRVNVLLKEFRAKRYHMAIVVDEYGGVSGLVTIEDILELIVGEIEDETDHDADNVQPIRRINQRVFSVHALTEVEDFNQYFGTTFTDEEFDTIGGMVMHAFGHLPARGETIEIDGYLFKIVSADKRRLALMQVKVPAAKLAQITEQTG